MNRSIWLRGWSLSFNLVVTRQQQGVSTFHLGRCLCQWNFIWRHSTRWSNVQGFSIIPIRVFFVLRHHMTNHVWKFYGFMIYQWFWRNTSLWQTQLLIPYFLTFLTIMRIYFIDELHWKINDKYRCTQVIKLFQSNLKYGETCDEYYKSQYIDKVTSSWLPFIKKKITRDTHF